MRHLSRLQIVFILLVSIFACHHADAQLYRANNNFQEFQSKPYYFGITLGTSNSRYKVFRGQNFVNRDSIVVAEGLRAPGFNVAAIFNLKIGDNFDFRATLVGFSFVERPIEFQTASGSTFTRRIESVFFEAPFLVRYKSAPYKDKRAFVVAGLKYSYDVASNSGTREAEQLIQLSPHDFQIEVGVGIQMFFPYFIFSPELKFSQGIGNILIFNNQLEEASILEKVLSRVITLSFHFEG